MPAKTRKATRNYNGKNILRQKAEVAARALHTKLGKFKKTAKASVRRVVRKFKKMVTHKGKKVRGGRANFIDPHAFDILY